MTSWFLECQIEGLESKMKVIISDWEALNRSLCDSELNDYNSMLGSLRRAQAIIDGNAARITGSSMYTGLSKNTEDQNEK